MGNKEDAMCETRDLLQGSLIACLFVLATGIAFAGPEFEILGIGSAYTGRPYGEPDSTGETLGDFTGYAFKVVVRGTPGFAEADIVQAGRVIGAAYMLGDSTAFLEFKGSLPDGEFALYHRDKPPAPPIRTDAALPLHPERETGWFAGRMAGPRRERRPEENLIGTYALEFKGRAVPESVFSIRQLEGDDPD
jgi:hypothetical protein